jgi:hypothetical protein
MHFTEVYRALSLPWRVFSTVALLTWWCTRTPGQKNDFPFSTRFKGTVFPSENQNLVPAQVQDKSVQSLRLSRIGVCHPVENTAWNLLNY